MIDHQLSCASGPTATVQCVSLRGVVIVHTIPWLLAKQDSTSTEWSPACLSPTGHAWPHAATLAARSPLQAASALWSLKAKLLVMRQQSQTNRSLHSCPYNACFSVCTVSAVAAYLRLVQAIWRLTVEGWYRCI